METHSRHALVIYDTRYGSTREVAEMIADRIGDRSLVREIGAVVPEELERASLVVIGGPVYGGRLSRRIPRFCDRNRSTLEQKRVGLFITCLYRGDMAKQQLHEGYPDWLIAHASATEWLGGRIRVKSLGFMHRMLVSRLGNLEGDTDRIDPNRIDDFVSRLADG